MKNLLFVILYGILLFPGHFTCSSDAFEVYLGALNKEQLEELRNKLAPRSSRRIQTQTKLITNEITADVQTYLATLSQKQLEILLNFINNNPQLINEEVVRRIKMYSNNQNTKEIQSPRTSEPSTAAPSSTTSNDSPRDLEKTKNLDATINLFDQVKPFLPSETDYRRSAESIQAIEITRAQKPQPDTEDMLRYMNKLRTSCPNLYGKKINDFLDALIDMVPENLAFDDDGVQNIRENLQNEKAAIISPVRFVHKDIAHTEEMIDERQYIKQADGEYEPKNVYEVDIPGSISGFALWLEIAMRPIPQIKEFLSEYYSQLLKQNANTPPVKARGAWLDAPNARKSALDATNPHDGYLRKQPAHANRPQNLDKTNPHGNFQPRPRSERRETPPPAAASPAATINFAELARAYPGEIEKAKMDLRIERTIGKLSQTENCIRFLLLTMTRYPNVYGARIMQFFESSIIPNIQNDFRAVILRSTVDKREIEKTWKELKEGNIPRTSIECMSQYIAVVAKSNPTIARLIANTFEQITADLDAITDGRPCAAIK